MRGTDNREALGLYRLAKGLLDEAGSDRLQIDDRLTLKRDGTVTSVIWRPYAFSQTALCVVDNGDDHPFVVTFVRGGWTRLIRKYAGAPTNAGLAETV